MIEYYLRPITQTKITIMGSASSEINSKVNAWMTVAKKISNFDKCTLLGYNILLNEIHGRMKSLNILDPTIQNVVVKVAGTAKIKTIPLPRYTSLWKLMCKIGE